MNIDKYITPDFHLAATLTALGFQMTNIDKTNPKRCLFVFNSNDELQKAVTDYYEGKIKIDPRDVLFQAKSVKNRLYGGI